MKNGLSADMNKYLVGVIKDYTGWTSARIVKSQYMYGEYALEVSHPGCDGHNSGFCVINGEVTNEFDPEIDKVGELKYGPSF